MDIRAKFQTDHALESEGVWVPIGDGARILIARLNNPAYRRLLREKVRGRERLLSAAALPEAAVERMHVEVIARTILLGWEGFTDGGQPLPYSVEAAERLLGEVRDFRDLVVGLAEDANLFRERGLEAAEKNSATSCASSSPPAATASAS